MGINAFFTDDASSRNATCRPSANDCPRGWSALPVSTNFGDAPAAQSSRCAEVIQEFVLGTTMTKLANHSRPFGWFEAEEFCNCGLDVRLFIGGIELAVTLALWS